MARRRFYLYTGEGQEVGKNVSHVIFDSAVQEIEQRAFYACRALVTVELNTGLQLIGYGAFCNCISLRTIVIPSTVKEIGDKAFVGCRSLLSMRLPESVQVIEDGVFWDCVALEDVELPPSMTDIGANTFRGCYNLVSVDLPQGIKVVSEGIFYGCESIRTMVVPSSVKEIAESAFAGCTNLASVELAEGLQKIGLYAFEACKSLTNIVIPSTVGIVDEHSFEDCDKLRGRFANGSLIDGLRHRFDGLPIHALCYQQCHYAEDATLEKLTQVLRSEAVTTLEKTDAFGMTPLHILTLSADPNWRMFVELLQFYPLHQMYKKDKWGESAIYYMCLTDAAAGLLTNTLVQSTIVERVKWLGLEKWRTSISNQCDSLFQSDDASGRVQEITNIYLKLALYERMEVTSLLELVLWKMKIDEAKSTVTATTTTTNNNNRKDLLVNHDGNEEEEERQESNPKRIKLDESVDRQKCRVSCGADDGIISKICSFLGKLGQG